MDNSFRLPAISVRVLGRVVMLWLTFTGDIVFSNEAIPVNNVPQMHLAARIERITQWALHKYDGKKVWLIYTTTGIVTCQFSAQEEPGSRANLPTLQQLIAGSSSKLAMPPSRRQAGVEPITPAQHHQPFPPGSEIKRPNSLQSSRYNTFAIILDYSFESGRPKLYQVSFQRLTDPFLKEKRPILWLGFAEAAQSLRWLKKQFVGTRYEPLQRQIVATLGQHDCPAELAALTQELVAGNDCISVKEAAIAMLQQQPSEQSLRLLIGLILNSADLRLTKKAMASLCQGKDPRGQAFVRALARQAPSTAVRKEAIFWLSQMADAQTVPVLQEIMLSNADIEIKEAAVFGISQLPDQKARGLLANIAQFDPSARIRQKARFWMQHTSEHRLPVFLNELIQVDASPLSK